jgi:hypothetical protein
MFFFFFNFFVMGQNHLCIMLSSLCLIFCIICNNSDVLFDRKFEHLLTGGLLQRFVQDNWRTLAFRSLKKLLLSACWHVLETDLGSLVILCSSRYFLYLLIVILVCDTVCCEFN